MKKSLILLLSLLTFGLFAQNIPPQAINFQGVAIDKDGVPVPGMDELGNPIPNKAIRVRFSILAGGSQANASYVEEHLTNTDEYGRFNLAIGRGSASVGTFSGIQWGDTAHFLKVEIDLSGIGTNYSLTSIQEFLSVPYALYAKTSGSSNGNDNDPDPTNEIQNLNINGNQLSISSGNSVQLPVSTDSQTLSLNGNALSIANGNTVQLPVDTDSQTLSLTGNTLSILNGNTVQLPVSLDNDTTNELQTLSLKGDTLQISNGNSVLIGSNNSTSPAVAKTPDNLCFTGGQFVDFTSLFSIYNTINVVQITSKYILAFCYNYGQTQPATLVRINRITGNFNPIATNLPSGLSQLSYGGCTDSISFFFGNNVIYWLNINNTSSSFTSTNSYANNTGILIDLKTNALYIEYTSGWYRYNYLNNSYLPLTLPSGPKTLIGADSLLIGSNLYNTNNSTIITNLSLSNYTETPVRIGPFIYYESTSSPGNYARIKFHNINTGLGGDLTSNYGYLNNWGSFIDPVNFSLNVIEKKLIVEYSGDPFRRINNHLIHTSSVTGVSTFSGGSYPYLSNAKELLEITVNGYVSTFKYGGFSNYGYSISRRGNYTFVHFNEPFGCHNGEIKKFPGIVIYDAL